MRIQHNIPALSAYRNYSRNVSMVSKNLEKLSSGYKINRAGDDAAGLAISEKMRIQISGLEQAQNNAKSGINLVQTAEGALTEVHDMLNRMYTLAEQSANGTYSDDVDREQLQKEVNSLRTEIDRIAEATNYNGINLLDGSLAKADAVQASSKTESLSFTGKDRILSSTIGKGEKPYDVAGVKTIFDTAAATPAKAKFEIDLGKMKFNAKVTTTATSNTTYAIDDKFVIDIGGTKVEVGGVAKASAGALTVEATASTAGDVVEKTITASKVASAIIQKLADSATATSAEAEINGVKWKVTQTSGKLTFEQVANPENEDQARANFDVGITVAKATATTAKHRLTMTDSIKAGTHVVTKGVPDGAAARANTVFKLTEEDIVDGAKITLGKKSYVLRVGANSKISSTNANAIDLSSMEEGAIDLNKALGAISNKFAGTFSAAIKYMDGTTEKTATVAFQVGVNDTSKGFPTGLAIQRTTDIGTSGSAKPALLKKLEDFDGLFKLEYEKTTTTEAQAAKNGLSLQIGDTPDEFNKLNVSIKDMHAGAMKYTAAEDATGFAKEADGMTLGEIDISTQDGASKAMSVIKAATNYVSDVRGDLGALQNRLDHTINNLSVTQENITDAESVIRDVDIAKEMMAYTKNNILVQSAQAMLAQANQLPQGVLQLLG